MFWLELKEFIKDSLNVIIILLVIIFIIMYVLSIAQVVGSSMDPTLKEKDVLVLNKLTYRFREPKRGDIVSLEHADTKYLIKRIIGLPGENVDIENNKVIIDGNILEEDYLVDNLEYDDFHLSDLGYEKIPDDMYFVLGDNRPDSLDSRKIGLISKDQIQGQIAFRFWPLNKMKFVK